LQSKQKGSKFYFFPYLDKCILRDNWWSPWKKGGCWVGRFIMFNDTFNNISVIWWRWVLLVKETG